METEVEYSHGCRSRSGISSWFARGNFIHRDLKPSNILLGDGMRAKVSDFGLIKILPDGENSIMGTCGYMAPEYASKFCAFIYFLM